MASLIVHSLNQRGITHLNSYVKTFFLFFFLHFFLLGYLIKLCYLIQLYVLFSLRLQVNRPQSLKILQAALFNIFKIEEISSSSTNKVSSRPFINLLVLSFNKTVVYYLTSVDLFSNLDFFLCSLLWSSSIVLPSV